MAEPLTQQELERLDAYWRAANYLSVGQIYLRDNPLLHDPLRLEHTKRRIVGHWGTVPGLTLIYVHLNRIIRKHQLEMLFIAGSGHGSNAILANLYLEGTYSEYYSDITRDAAGLKKFFQQFAFPGGVPSHIAPDTPGAIHEGGELGYSLAHAFGAAFDNPELVVAVAVGDGEAETGPLAASWHSNKFLNPKRDGAVLPILHLNGYKISNPTLLGRMSDTDLRQFFSGLGYESLFVEGEDPFRVHRELASAFDSAVHSIRSIQSRARQNQAIDLPPRWPIVILRTPKGWTGPKQVKGKPVENTWRSHELPLEDLTADENELRELEQWLKSYRPEELFDGDGRLLPELAELAPEGPQRMGSNPHANGGVLLKDLQLPDFRDYALPLEKPGAAEKSATAVLGEFLRDVFRANANAANFRLFGPDETATNKLSEVLQATDKVQLQPGLPTDEHIGTDGRVMEILSEHVCQGWLEAYLLTGRHGLFGSYEGFIHVIDSMFNQHAKWLEAADMVAWRRPVASLNYLLTSHAWGQDRNGFTHQNPGFITHVLNKKNKFIRVYLPPDANTLLAAMSECLSSRNRANVVVAQHKPSPQWLDMDAAIAHCAAGVSVWEWASTSAEPDFVMACAGDVPTLETLAAAKLLRREQPDLSIRVVNVVSLTRLQPHSEDEMGLDQDTFEAIFTAEKPVIFAFHGYPSLIYSLVGKRKNAHRFHVFGYREEGDLTTPFDMRVKNGIDRFHLALAALDQLPRTDHKRETLREEINARLRDHATYIIQNGEDLPEIRNWTWAG